MDFLELTFVKIFGWMNETLFFLSFLNAVTTDYGRQGKPFFGKISNFWAWADKFWGIWGIFGRFVSTHFGTLSSLSMFSINQPLFLQKTKPLQIPNIYLELGFEIEFGPQKIRDLAIVCP